MTYYYILELVGVTDVNVEEGEGRNALEMARSVSDKHLDLLRPSARYYSIFKGQATDSTDRAKGKYTLIRGEDDTQLGLYDKPLPCFGCGIGWFSFLLGFLCPLMWYYATILYFGNYYRKDPRERAGLAASAIAAMGCSIILLIVVLVLIF
ncbi:ribosomal protein L18ae family [Striga asiatica]|uniref:Ribosomal protein L18ae family n=1 Tax=Striga asiatica TaxID=4170 RepID=A0A5A7PT90_STRAF|nr:ribosomal protein L18ae family [Striga asiatica]